MPLGMKSECVKCKTTECFMWNTSPEGELCLQCFNESKVAIIVKEEEPSVRPSIGLGLGLPEMINKNDHNGPKIATRRSTRSTSTRSGKMRSNPYALPKPPAPKGKGRRIIFKKAPTKAPSAVATPVTSNHVFYKGRYIQVGDVVSVRDIEGGLFYAQIRGLLTDQYCEKSAVITWLIPTQESPDPEEGFDPTTYIIGPDEDLLRKLDCMEFICHAPSNYFKARTTPFPPVLPEPSDANFIWTRIESQI